jgi:uncharacterized protein YxeA
VINIKRKLIVIIALLFMVAVGAFFYKNTMNNRIPKSAKLVLLQQNKCSVIG